MSSIKSIVMNMIILGIFVFGIMNFIIIMQVNNSVSPENRITNNSLINKSHGNLASSLNQQTTAETSLNSLEDVPPTEYVGDLDVGSTVSTTRTTRSIIVGLWNIYIQLPLIILGVSSVVAGAITSILLTFIAIGIWAIWKGAIS